MATTTLRAVRNPPLGRIALSILLLIGAIAASAIVALSNSLWFDILNSFVGATDAVTRGLLFSSWLLVIGGPIVIWRPRAFGFQLGDLRSHLGLVGTTVVAAVVVTIVLLRLIGSTPYSNASLFIEAVDVPVTEELVFRAVMLTALLAALGQLWSTPTAVVLAIVINGLAFGAAHLANLITNPSAFTIGQAVFAAVLGGLCAFLMAKTRSVYPAILLHAAVNAAVVLAS